MQIKRLRYASLFIKEYLIISYTTDKLKQIEFIAICSSSGLFKLVTISCSVAAYTDVKLKS